MRGSYLSAPTMAARRAGWRVTLGLGGRHRMAWLAAALCMHVWSHCAAVEAPLG